MKKIDPTILKETGYIFAVTLIFSALMQSVFLIIGKWNYTVLLGNLLGLCGGVGNFFLMGLTVQSALNKSQDDAKKFMKLSQSLRMLLLFVVAMVGYLAPCFNLIGVVIPLVFPRFGIAIRSAFIKK